MTSIGFDLSALDPHFKSHSQRGIGRYVRELSRILKTYQEPDLDLEFFDHSDLRTPSLVDNLVSLCPVGRTSIHQHLVYPRRLSCGRFESLSLFHFPAHMDAPAFISRPFVLTVHDLIPHLLKDLYRVDKPELRFRVARALERISIKRATFLLSVSENTAQDVVRVLGVPRERIMVTPLGVDAHFYRSAEMRSKFSSDHKNEIRAKHGIPLGRPIVLYVGGHDERKNISNLLAIVRGAESTLRSQGKASPVVVLVGRLFTEVERARLSAALQQSDMQSDAVVLGFLSDEELLELYAESSLFLFPSLYEGFGLPPLEAMAAGLPVVASNTSSIPEVVGNAGVLFNPRSVEEGVAAVLSVLDNHDRARRLAQLGIERARTFTWERTASTTLEGYRRAAELVGGLNRLQGGAKNRVVGSKSEVLESTL